MDEITIAAIVTSGVLSGAVAWLIAKAAAKPVPLMQLQTHTHEYNHLVDGKWACAHCEGIRPNGG